MPTVTYPSGAVLSTSAITAAQMQLIWQVLALQMLGIPAWFDSATTTANSNVVAVENGGLYSQGQEFWLPGVVPGVPAATIQSISGNNLTLSVAALSAVTGAQCTICNPGAFSQVRTEWPPNGQADWSNTQDVAFVGCVETDDPYDRIRDQIITPNDDVSVTRTQTYTRVWRISFTLYGPNSTTNANLLRSGLFQDFVAQFLAGYSLALVTDYKPPIRAPELFQGQWYERVDFDFSLNELVTETTTVSTAASVEVKVYNANGLLADFTVSEGA